MDRLQQKTSLHALEDRVDGKTPFRIFGNDGVAYNNTITIFNSVPKKRKRVAAAAETAEGADGAAAVPAPQLEIHKYVCNFVFIVVGTIQPVIRASAGVSAPSAGSISTTIKATPGSGKVLAIYKQGAAASAVPSLMAIPATNTTNQAAIRCAFQGFNAELHCNLKENHFNEMVMADVQCWSESGEDIPKYFSLCTIGVNKHPTTGRLYFVLLDVCIDMKTGRAKSIAETKLLLLPDALSQGLTGKDRCLLQSYPRLPKRDMEKARLVFELIGQGVRTYYSSFPGSSLFPEALHVLASGCLQALAHSDLIARFGCCAIMNICSVQGERGKTLICALLQAMFGWNNAALQDITPSSIMDVVDVVSGIPVVLDDPRGREDELAKMTHTCYNGQPTATMVRGARKCCTKVVVATNTPWMGLTVTKPQDGATFTRIVPVRFDLPPGSADEKPKLGNSNVVAKYLRDAPVTFFHLLTLLKTFHMDLDLDQPDYDAVRFLHARMQCMFLHRYLSIDRSIDRSNPGGPPERAIQS